MKRRIALSVFLIVVNLALAVASFICLPDTVVTQVSLGASGSSTMPKLLAVALPTLLGLGGAVVSAQPGGDEKTRNKAIIVSVVGVLVFAIMLAVNL